MQAMPRCSVSCAIENMWLAAPAENIGMGWVSFFEPADVAALLGCTDGSKPGALFYLGPVESFYERPMLEAECWRHRENMDLILAENRYSVQQQ